MAIKVKLDLSKLKSEFVYESSHINNQEDIETELGYAELTYAIMQQITIIEEKYIEK